MSIPETAASASGIHSRRCDTARLQDNLGWRPLDIGVGTEVAQGSYGPPVTRDVHHPSPRWGYRLFPSPWRLAVSAQNPARERSQAFGDTERFNQTMQEFQDPSRPDPRTSVALVPEWCIRLLLPRMCLTRERPPTGRSNPPKGFLACGGIDARGCSCVADARQKRFVRGLGVP